MNGIYLYWVSYRDGKGKDVCPLQGGYLLLVPLRQGIDLLLDAASSHRLRSISSFDEQSRILRNTPLYCLYTVHLHSLHSQHFPVFTVLFCLFYWAENACYKLYQKNSLPIYIWLLFISNMSNCGGFFFINIIDSNINHFVFYIRGSTHRITDTVNAR